MKTNFYISIGLGIFLMFSAAEAQPAESEIIIDQMEASIDSTSGVVLAIGGQSKQRLAQIITAGQNGDLVGLFLPISCGTGRLVIEVRDLNGDQPGDVVLVQHQFPAVEVPSLGPVFHLFEFHDPLVFASGDRFAVVLQNPEGACSIYRGPVGDSYTGGEGFFEAIPNPPGWVPFSEFANARQDLPFMTEMQLPGAVTVLTIALDVKPSSSENAINPKSRGVIPVAILSTTTFDASTVDQASLRLGPDQALAEGNGHFADVNGDRLPDLVLHFRTQDTGIQCDDTSVSITGETVDGIPIKGSDTIHTVGCKAKTGKKGKVQQQNHRD